MKIAAIILIILGAVTLSYEGFSYLTEEKVLDVGPVEVTSEERKWVPIPPAVGVLALAGGVILLIVSARQTTTA